MPTTLPASVPLGAPTLSGSTVTVDALLASPSRISAQVRTLVAANQGYFAEEIFATPGFTVQGGAIIYDDVTATGLFLDPDHSLRPRAPGSEAPRIAALRGEPKIARPESWSGSLEVHDEVRRRNQVIAVTNAMTAAANTFADRIQSSAIAALNDAITSWGRELDGVNWGAAYSSGVPNADPATLPQRDFALAVKQFITDKAGVRPDVLILNEDDAFKLDLVYGDKLPALLDRYGLRLRVSPQQTAGKAIFAKAKQVGVLAFEKPLDTEYTREGTRKTDVYTMEATPVFVANDQTAVVRVDID